MPSLTTPAHPSCISLSQCSLPHYHFANPPPVVLLDMAQVIVSYSELCVLKGAALAVVPYSQCVPPSASSHPFHGCILFSPSCTVLVFLSVAIVVFSLLSDQTVILWLISPCSQLFLPCFASLVR